MIKSDRIYQVLLKYNFDLFRGSKSMVEYISEHLTQYYTEIVSATEENNDFLGDSFIQKLKERIPILESICHEIPTILADFDNGHIKDAYIKSSSLFDRVEPYLLRRLSWYGNCGSFYRIRKGDFRIKDPSDSKKQKTELFHIKKELRSRIGAYRYSVAGYPCLYLASDRELAWFECGMPKQFSFCQMVITEEGEDALKLIDFSHRPVDLLSSVTIWILNARRQDKDEDEITKIYDFLIKYIITYPLAAACSIKVKNRGNKYVEEYVFPQLFMSWIRESDDIDGVRYKSSLNSTLVRGMGAINVALPVKRFREDGLDERLTSKIGISDIGYLDVNKDFQRYQSVLDDLEVYINKLRVYIIESPFVGQYIEELIELSECIIKTYTALMEGNYLNSELLFTYVDRLCDYTELLYSNRKIMAQKTVDGAPSDKKKFIDEEVIESQFEEFYTLARKILRKHTVFDFTFESMANFEYL